MAAAQQQIVVGGENIVVKVVDAADLFARIEDDKIKQWLCAAGFVEGQYLEETLQAFNENGFDLPNAWVAPVRSELIELNVGAGYVSGVIESFQKELVQQLGVVFVRKMQPGSVQTNQQIAAAILNAKHAPELPSVSVDTGYAPLPDVWRHSMESIEGWVRPQCVRQIQDNYAVADDELAVPIGSVISIALGTVLRGKCGLGEMRRVLPQAISARGDGLEMLRSIQGTVFADLEDALVQQWQFPVPVTQAHLVEAAAMEWNKQREYLRKLKRMIVDDPAVAKASVEQLLGGTPTVKAILNSLKLQHGSRLTVEQILDRVAIDSGVWLAEKNATAVLRGSGTVGAAAAAINCSGECSSVHRAER